MPISQAAVPSASTLTRLSPTPSLDPRRPREDHARSSSFRSPDSTRSENVAMTIEKMTTTIA